MLARSMERPCQVEGRVGQRSCVVVVTQCLWPSLYTAPSNQGVPSPISREAVITYLTHQGWPCKLSTWSANTALQTPCSARSNTSRTWKPVSPLWPRFGGRLASNAHDARQDPKRLIA